MIELLDLLKNVDSLCEGGGVKEEIVYEVVVGNWIEVLEDLLEQGKHSN